MRKCGYCGLNEALWLDAGLVRVCGDCIAYAHGELRDLASIDRAIAAKRAERRRVLVRGWSVARRERARW